MADMNEPKDDELEGDGEGDYPTTITERKFDADEDPEEKGAEARADMPEGYKVKFLNRKKGQFLSTDLDEEPSYPPDLPSPSLSHVEGKRKMSLAEKIYSKRNKVINGWEQMNETNFWDHASFVAKEEYLLMDRERDPKTFIENFIPSFLYGTWYHDAAILAFAIISTFICTKYFDAGIMIMIFIGLACSTIYQTSTKRMRRNLRDDIHRRLCYKKLETDEETMDWINLFLQKFWLLYEPVLSAQIVSEVDQILAENCPPFLEKLRFKKFTLGTKAPRVESVRSYPKAAPDVVLMDWRFSFTPNDIADMTERQIQQKVNPEVVLETRFGKGFATLGVDVTCKDISVSAYMRVKIVLMKRFPHIRTVYISLLEEPQYDFVLKPLSSAFDINIIPGLRSFIDDQVYKQLAPILIKPNYLTINVEEMLIGGGFDSAVGVLQCTVLYAKGLKSLNQPESKPNPFVKMSFLGGPELARTSTKDSEDFPKWRETKYMLCKDLTTQFVLDVYDFDFKRGEKLLGSCLVPCSLIEKKKNLSKHQSNILYEGKVRGQIVFDINWFPATQPIQNSEQDVVEEDALAESEAGIVRLTIISANEIALASPKSVNSKVSVLLNGNEFHDTPVIKQSVNPQWYDSVEFLVSSRSDCRIGLRVKNVKNGEHLGTYQAMLNDLIESSKNSKHEFELSNSVSGKISLLTLWRPLRLSNLKKDGYRMPMGVLRIFIDQVNLLEHSKNAASIRVASPYCLGDYKTMIMKPDNDSKFEFNEFLYMSVVQSGQKFLFELLGEKSRQLGVCSFRASELATKSDSDEWITSELKNFQLELNCLRTKKTIGTISFAAQFVPSLNASDPFEREEEILDMVQASDKDRASPTLEGSEFPPTPTEIVNEAQDEQISEIHNGHRKSKSSDSNKIRLLPEELLAYQAGFVIFNVIKGSLNQKNLIVSLQFDDGAYPVFSTSRAFDTNAGWNEVGEGFVRDLDHSVVRIRLSKSSDPEDPPLAQVSAKTIDILREGLNNPTIISLVQTDDYTAKVEISFKYIPVNIDLSPVEMITNQGLLKLDIVRGIDLLPADRSGKSDPMIHVNFNGARIYKTKVIKKTLNPVFNESTELHLYSRLSNILKLEVYDWDVAKFDPMGDGIIDIASIPVDKKTTQEVLLDTGKIVINMHFIPQWVSRSRVRSSTTFVSGVLGRAQTVAGIPLKGVELVGSAAVTGLGGAAKFAGNAAFTGVGGAAKFAGNAAFSGVGGAARLASKAINFGKKDTREATSDASPTPDASPCGEAASEEIPTEKVGNSETEQEGSSNDNSSDSQKRDVQFNIREGHGFGSRRVSISIKHKNKHVLQTKPQKGPDLTFNDSIAFKAGPDDEAIVQAKEIGMFGSKQKIGEASISLSGSNTEKEVVLDIGESKSATLKIDTSFSNG